MTPHAMRQLIALFLGMGSFPMIAVGQPTEVVDSRFLEIVKPQCFAIVPRTERVVIGRNPLVGDCAILWDLALNQQVASHNEHANIIGTVAASFDGRFIASGSDDGRVVIWPADAKSRPRIIFKCESSIDALMFSADSKRLVVVARDGKVITIDLSSEQELKDLRFDVGVRINGPVAVSAADGRVAIATDDNDVTVHSGAPFADVLRIAGHKNRLMQLSFSLDGKTLLAADAGEHLYLWDTYSAKAIRRSKVPKLSCASFSGDYTLVLAGTATGVISFYEAATLSHVGSIIARKPAGAIGAVAMSKDRRTLIYKSIDPHTATLFSATVPKAIVVHSIR